MPLGNWLACLSLLLLTPVVHAAGAGNDLVFTPAPKVLHPERQQLLDIALAGDRMVAVGAAGLVVISDDQGNSWRQVNDVPVSATLTAVSFPGDDIGWAVGHAGVILHSKDAGLSWEKQFDGYAAAKAFLDWARQQRLDLEDQLAELDTRQEEAGEDSSNTDREALEYALDDALFMEEEAALAVESGPADPFLDVAFFDEQRGLAVGAYGMSFRTSDGGVNWRINQAGIDNVDRFHLYGVYVHDEQVYLTGEAGLLFHSEDYGESFMRFQDVYEGSLFAAVPFGDGILSFGLRGNVFLQREGEEIWESVATPSENSLYGGQALLDGGALLFGAGGTILRLHHEAPAQLFRHPSRSTFSAAVQTKEGELWLVGMDGVARFSEAQVQ